MAARMTIAPVEKRLTFPYGHVLVAIRIAYYGSLIVLVAVALVFLPFLAPIPVALFGLLVAAVFIVFAISPLWTDHWLTRSRLILRQGWYFRSVIPMSEIESLGPIEEANPLLAPLGIHRPLGQPTLYVTGGRTGLVMVRLTQPRRFWQAFGFTASEIVFDVGDRAGFLAAYEERRRLLAPV